MIDSKLTQLEHLTDPQCYAVLKSKVMSGRALEVLEDLATQAQERRERPEFLHLEAYARAHSGAFRQGVTIWEKLLEQDYWSEDVVRELARAYTALDRAIDAAEILDEWLADGDVVDRKSCEKERIAALLNVASPEAAERVLMLLDEIVVAEGGSDPEMRRLRARVIAGRWDELDSNLADGEGIEDGLLRLALLLCQREYLSEALLLYVHQRDRYGNSVERAITIAKLQMRMGLDDSAMDTLAEAYENYGDTEDLLIAITKTCLADRLFRLAAAWGTKLEEQYGELPHVRALLGEVMIALGDLSGVQEFMQQVDPDDETMDELRVAYFSRINQPAQALDYQARVVEKNNRAPAALIAQARLAGEAGLKADAIELAWEADERLPGAVGVSAIFAAHQGKDLERKHVLNLHKAISQGGKSGRQKAWLSHCLAEYYHSVGNYELAAELYDQCNRLSEQLVEGRYDKTRHRAWLDEIIAAFDTVEFSVPTTTNGPVPVFIVGVPRSGTTLTEQILARHPQIAGMGECPHINQSLGWVMKPGESLDQLVSSLDNGALEKLRRRFLSLFRPFGGAAENPHQHFYVDKMPDNYQFIGWIYLLFPEAKVIYAKRDPREIALSCWRANFGAIEWAFNIEDIADRIVQHHTIMRYWMDRLGDRIYVSEYKELVNQPKAHTASMLKFLGLEMHDACLDHAAAPTIVRTASVHQVRKPIYTDSLKGWQKYESSIRPAISMFLDAGIQ